MKKKKVNKKNIILLSGLTIGTTATLSVYFIVKTFGNPFGGGGSGAITPPKVVSLQQPSVYCPIYKLTFDQYVNLSEPLITNKSDDSVVFGVNFSFSIETSTISLINDDDLLRIVNKEVKLNLKAKNSVG
jgi:hypothetical protein